MIIGNLKTDRTMSKTFPVGKKLVCTMTIGAEGATCEWSPAAPDYLTERELRDYRKGRNALFVAFSEMVGCEMLVVDI